MHPDVVAQTEKLIKGTSEIWQSQMLTVWGSCKKSSAMLGILRQCNISCRMPSRDSPGWPHYSTMGRWICAAARMPNVGVILKKK
jgi:hypothetical protein